MEKFTFKNLVKDAISFKNVYFSILKKISFLTLFLVAVACSPQEEETLNLEANLISEREVEGFNKTYKGIFASKESQQRGTLNLQLLDVIENNPITAAGGKAILTLQQGQTYQAVFNDSRSTGKSTEDFKVAFDSEDLQFNFFLDETGSPVISDVVFKKESGSIVVSEHTAENPVTPITGTYRCTNCEDQTSSLNGIELNNNERVFNMLLSTKDGQKQMTLQAVLGSLVNAELLIEQSCSNSGEYTFCNLSTGTNATTEPVKWSGVHRFTTNSNIENNCSTLWGNVAFMSPENGLIQAEFSSDNTCPNNTYYVSSSGNDLNSGLTPADAWQSVEKINNTTIKPGDVVLLEGGQTFEGPLKFRSDDANNAANPVKVSSYGSGRATIKVDKGNGIDIYNTAGIIISDLIVAGNNTIADKSAGIQFYNDLEGNVKLDFAEVKNCEVFGFRDYGIVLGSYNQNSLNAGFNNVLIENNKVYDIADVGISSYGHFSATKSGYAHSNVTVRNCEVFNIKGYTRADGNHSGNGIMLSNVQNSVIEYSTVYNSGSGNTKKSGGPVGIWYWDADQVVIQHNEVYGMASGTNKDGGGFDLDGGVTNGVIQYNYSHDNEGGGYLIGQFPGARPMRNITVRFNISQNDASTNGGSVYLFNGEGTGDMTDIYVHNNTFYASHAPAIHLLAWKPVTENINFYNNVLYSTNGAKLVHVPSGHDARFAGNLYHSTESFRVEYKGTSYGSLESFRKTGNEIFDGKPVGVQERPLLTNPGNGGTIGFGNSLNKLTAYRLQSGSPAIDAGVKLNIEEGIQDFYGNDIAQDERPEAGAHAGLTSGSIVSN